MSYKITCGGCGSVETRKYLPEKMFCHSCGEVYFVDDWEVEEKE